MGLVSKLAPAPAIRRKSALARRLTVNGKCCKGLHCTCELTCSCPCKNCVCGELEGA